MRGGLREKKGEDEGNRRVKEEEDWEMKKRCG